ncbi:MAG: hypothetical protein OEY77_01500 [Nitrospira sp.]|nr:hypothetical protein [Nitrospira sp.]
MNMYRLMGRVLLTLPMVAMPMQAEASLDLLARITKTKDIRVAERVFIDKNIRIAVTLRQRYDGAAEADSVSNQLNEFNDVRGNIQGPVPRNPSYGINRHASIVRSINRNEGIVGVNQDVGNMVNQGNVVAAALTRTPRSVTNSQAEADQVNRFNNVIQLERIRVVNGQIQGDPDRSATINASVNFNSGVVGVNQNSGNMNNQLNKLALAVGPGSHVALSEAALGQVNTRNRVLEQETYRIDLISNSASNNSGIVGVNQSSGNMNNQASVVSMAVLTSTVKLTTP